MKVVNFIKKYALTIFYFGFAGFLYYFVIFKNKEELNLIILIFILMLISMGFVQLFAVNNKMDKKKKEKLTKIYEKLTMFFYVLLFVGAIVLFLLAGFGIIK